MKSDREKLLTELLTLAYVALPYGESALLARIGGALWGKVAVEQLAEAAPSAEPIVAEIRRLLNELHKTAPVLAFEAEARLGQWLY